MKPSFITPALLALAVVLSALLVVKSKHDNRRLMTELTELRAAAAQLDTEWAQLQLEEATLAHHGRIETLARDRLGMAQPSDYVIVPHQVAR